MTQSTENSVPRVESELVYARTGDPLPAYHGRNADGTAHLVDLPCDHCERPKPRTVLNCARCGMARGYLCSDCLTAYNEAGNTLCDGCASDVQP